MEEDFIRWGYRRGATCHLRPIGFGPTSVKKEVSWGILNYMIMTPSSARTLLISIMKIKENSGALIQRSP